MHQNKQNKNRLINTGNKLVVARGEGARRWVKQVKGLKRYKLPVIKYVSHGDESTA